MEQEFYRSRLERLYGFTVHVPAVDSREIVHRVIYDELCRGVISETSRAAFGKIVSELVGGGAAGIILGCTEVGLLLRPADSPVPLFDTTRIHAEAAAAFALGPQPNGV
jgi:aspartate racemase